MNMWAVSELPVYPTKREARRKGSKKSKVLGLDSSPKPTGPPAVQPVTSSEVADHDACLGDGLLDPAVDGPPSPECLRELSKQMQRASFREKHHSHQASSSGSSSLRSLTSADRPSWDAALEGKSLSRKSSGRSTSSTMPPRDRPDSVQIFGKTIFNRKGKLRRESNAQTPEPAVDASAPSRDSTIPTFFGLRRGTKQEQAGEPQRKFTISGPYNFQHLAHTQKDQLPDLRRTDQAALASEFSQLQTSQAPAAGASKGTWADDVNFAGFSSDSLPLNDADGAPVSAPDAQAPATTSRPPSVLKKRSSARRLLSRSQSQEQLPTTVPPPRPPRSPPVERPAAFGPPVPPLRLPSRASVRHERFDSVDRPQTSTGFRSPQSFTFSDAGSPPATSYGYVPGPDMDVIPENMYSNVTSPPDDANWPLPCPSSTASEFSLPNVPEEDEALLVSKKCRASISSNPSLRGSQSVPMLRAQCVRQHDDSGRRCSDASDTLGRFDSFAAQLAIRAALENSRGGTLPREAWEDDIDYCYEHAAEADCEYEWGRPSFDVSRDGDSATPVDDRGRSVESGETSPTMLMPEQFDVPALSPVSQLSSATAQEAITPTGVNNPKASNFSLPRVDSKNLLHVRKPSDASSFKESHGFTLSPSLLIPMDYQQQMMACEEDLRDSSDFSFPSMDPSAMLRRYRASSSTTGTIESINSGSEKHISTASTSTDFSHLTPSTTSLDIEQLIPKAEPLQPFPAFESHIRVEKCAMPTLPESEAVAQPSTRRRGFRSRGSESNLGRLAMDEPWPGKAKMSIQARRGRARATSLSTPPPPNQYALFPSVQLGGNRI